MPLVLIRGFAVSTHMSKVTTCASSVQKQIPPGTSRLFIMAHSPFITLLHFFFLTFFTFLQLSVELLSSCLHIQVVSVAEYHRRIDALNSEELRTLCRRLQVPSSVV